jgi:hypothetical protein
LLVVWLSVAWRARLALRLVLNVAPAIVVPKAISAIRPVALRPILRSLAPPIAVVTATAPLHIVSRVDAVVVQWF